MYASPVINEAYTCSQLKIYIEGVSSSVDAFVYYSPEGATSVTGWSKLDFCLNNIQNVNMHYFFVLIFGYSL